MTDRSIENIEKLLDEFWPNRTPANVRSDEESDAIQDWLAAYFGDVHEEPVLSAQYYGDCECDLGRAICASIDNTVYDGSYAEGSPGGDDSQLKFGRSSTPETINAYTIFRNIANPAEQQNLPSDATVLQSYITFQANGNSGTGTLNGIVISGGLDCRADAPVPDYGALDRTTNTVTWSSIANWIDGTSYDTPDLSAIIQEIIESADWDPSLGTCNLPIYFAGPASGSENLRVAHDFANSGTEPILTVCWAYNNVGSGGLRGGGSAKISFNEAKPTSGGILAGGSPRLSLRHTEYPTGGVVCSGDGDQQNYEETGTGGLVGAGSAPVDCTYRIASAGGVYCQRSPFPNGFHYRQQICIPAGIVSNPVACFPVILKIKTVEDRMANQHDFLFTDLAGNVLNGDGRILENGCWVGSVKVDLDPAGLCVNFFYGED